MSYFNINVVKYSLTETVLALIPPNFGRNYLMPCWMIYLTESIVSPWEIWSPLDSLSTNLFYYFTPLKGGNFTLSYIIRASNKSKLMFSGL